ncbi:MAG: hypothetical protein NZ693_03745 [Thermoflexales bacterium]|nr:hypothetical protein [Thermoflexales bacterium]
MIYAPVWGIPLLHDDGLIVWLVRYRHLFGSEFGDPIFRPSAYFPWQVTRALLGWYESAPIHFFNVAAHLVSTSLVFQLVLRLTYLTTGSTNWLQAFVAAVLFGGHPLFNQTLLWASALVHPLLTAFGLGATHAYLSARFAQTWAAQCALILLASLLVLGGCLSNEAGFMGALWVGIVETYLAGRAMRDKRRRIWWAVAIPLLVAATYVVLYRLLFNAAWSRHGIYALAHPVESIRSLVYLAQGLIMPAVVLLRPFLGLDEQRYTVVALIFIATVIGMLAALARARRLSWGVMSLSWWSISAGLFAAALEHNYVLYAPRLNYAPMVGGVLLLSSIVSLALQRSGAWLRALSALAVVAWAIWSAGYITRLAHEAARLLPALRLIDEDIKHTKNDDQILLINAPQWSAPAVPLLLVGTEGMPIASVQAPADLWLGAMSGTYRRTTALRHDISLTRSDSFAYGILGDFADDGALRAALLKSNRVYRFDYDPPRYLRARRLAAIEPAEQPVAWLAKFCYKQACTALIDARWQRCSTELALHLTWQHLAPTQAQTGVFVHGLSEANTQLWVADRDLVDGYLPIEQLPAGLRLTETRFLPSLEQHPDLRQVSLGLYDRGTVERFEATLSDGSKAAEVRLVVPTSDVGCMN